MSNKVFRMNECEWWAINGTKEDMISYYNENIDTIDEDNIDEVEECDIEQEGLWNELDMTDEYKEKLKGHNEWRNVEGETNFGDLKIIAGTLFKYISFKEEIGEKEIKEPYCIACTEY